MDQARPIICLTPVLNEAVKLPRFLAAASTWANHIIVADQMSTDGSREIARQYAKVTLVDNTSESLDEAYRQSLMVSAARKISANAVLVFLDADEFLTGNFATEPEWRWFLKSPPATVANFKWLQVMPEAKSFWEDVRLPFAFIDDPDQDPGGRRFHSLRVPFAPSQIQYMNRVSVLHYHYFYWQEVLAKIRFYQCYDTFLYPDKHPVDLYRFYNKYQRRAREYRELPEEFLAYYKSQDIDMTSLVPASYEKWNRKTLDLLAEHGAARFRKAQIWGVNWNKIAQHNKVDLPELSDPRSLRQRLLHRYLFKTQSRKDMRSVRMLDSLLKRMSF